jgi:pyrimidine operon attenuation protein/uracil phosphoribosyltransferase
MSPLPNPLPDAEAQCRQLADLIRPQLARNPALVGIYSGGAWIAERLKELLGLSEEIGLIDVSFYRDDFAEKGLHPQAGRPSSLRCRRPRTSSWSMTCSTPAARPAPRSTNCSTTAARPRSSWPCWPTAAAASCRSRRAYGVWDVALADGQNLVLARNDDGQLAWRLEENA